LLQVIRIIPYSAVQLFSYEVYKVVIMSHLPTKMYYPLFAFFCLTVQLQKIFRKKDGDLSVLGRLVAGACAGMTSTLVSSSRLAPVFIIYYFSVVISKSPFVTFIGVLCNHSFFYI
jgi:hypothetical protein